MTTERPPEVEPFLRGAPFPAAGDVAYPRADPKDTRLPQDTWTMACVPATVRLELVAEGAEAVEIGYRTATDQLGYRGEGAGTTFALWQGDDPVDERPAVLGEGTVRLGLVGSGEPAVVYLPEGMRPTILSVTGVGCDVAPAPAGPRWVAYGDSILEGWVATGPARCWPAVTARSLGLDVVNLGYAGAARGEMASAEQVAALPADVISVSHGTNCWTRTPHSAGMMRETTAAFLEVVRGGHPTTPIVVPSPVLRPDAEATPNRLGATLVDLRAAMEEAVQARIDAGDRALTLVPGGDVLTADHLPDGIHPGDEGHELLAEVFGGAVGAALGRGTGR
ncbi:MAG TPA: GDSL-type esterase/lipase family protein [Acidimicrobiales bacterium]|nr:GDSL-type esterase/lipase family protein [Acidimicrobiales bacterium]